MLALAVLACLILQDGETVKNGGHEVSGKISVSSEARSRAEAPAPEASRKEERAGVARVKVLELAKAAAENKARAEATPAEKPEAAPSEVPSEAPIEAPRAEEPAVGASRNEPLISIESEALALLRGELPASEVRALPEEKPAEARSELPAAGNEEKAEPAAPVKDAPAPQKVEAGKPEAKKAPENQPKEKKAETRKPAEKKAEGKKPSRQHSAVESALADARSGRLSPVEDVLVSDDPAKTYDRVVTSAKFSMKGSLIKLTLRGNSPMIGHFYVLEAPDRVVLDLAGNWQIDVPKVPSNRLIGGVRVGQHEDKTRLVFDMKTPGKAALVPLNRNALELRIK